MSGPSALSKIFERDQKILNVVKIFWTCSKFFGCVQKIWMWSKIARNGKNLKKKICSKFLNKAKKFLNTSKIFQHIQNFLNMFKKFWTEQMDRAYGKVYFTYRMLKFWISPSNLTHSSANERQCLLFHLADEWVRLEGHERNLKEIY